MLYTVQMITGFCRGGSIGCGGVKRSGAFSFTFLPACFTCAERTRWNGIGSNRIERTTSHNPTLIRSVVSHLNHMQIVASGFLLWRVHRAILFVAASYRVVLCAGLERLGGSGSGVVRCCDVLRLRSVLPPQLQPNPIQTTRKSAVQCIR